MKEAKEIAERLVSRFMGVVYPIHQEDVGKEIHINKAKECAVICVDEILIELEEPENWFWYNVKEQIKSL